MFQTRNFSHLRRLFFLIPLAAFWFIPAPAAAEQVKLVWKANQESNLAGYRLHFGTRSKSYSKTIEVGNRNRYVVKGLTAGTTYYFAATAYNDQGVESGYSREVSWTAPGGDPSLGITDLLPGDYRIAPLQVGDTYYTDRNFRITSLPADFRGMTAIRTANNDKYDARSKFLSFTVHHKAAIYVAYDARATRMPAWLTANFTDTGRIIETSDVTMTLWQRKVPAGNVTLPGNHHGNPQGANSNYFVLVK